MRDRKHGIPPPERPIEPDGGTPQPAACRRIRRASLADHQGCEGDKHTQCTEPCRRLLTRHLHQAIQRQGQRTGPSRLLDTKARWHQTERDRANASMAPARIPGAASGSVTVQNARIGLAPKVRAASSSSAHSLDRQANGSYHQRKGHDRCRQDRPPPRKGQRHTERIEQGPQRPATAKQAEHQVPDHDRRKYQRQVNESIDHRLARKLDPRQQPSHADARRQADHHAGRHPYRQSERLEPSGVRLMMGRRLPTPGFVAVLRAVADRRGLVDGQRLNAGVHARP